MMSSNRVLSGSITKGSTATLSGSAKYFYQGINARTFDSYFGSTLTRVGSGDRIELYKDGNLISPTTFDDSTVLNNDSADLGGENDRRLEERIGFFYEKRNFGQSVNTLAEKAFADTIDFDPVVYIKDQDEVMWPSQIWNAGAVEDYEYDGIIEPLDIRDEIYGKIVAKEEGRTIRGSLTGCSSERPWGSKEITDKWFVYDNQESAFLDAPVILEGSVHEQQAEQRLIDTTTNTLSPDFAIVRGAGTTSTNLLFRDILLLTPAGGELQVTSTAAGRLKNGRYQVTFQIFFSKEYKSWGGTGNETITISAFGGTVDKPPETVVAQLPVKGIPTLRQALTGERQTQDATFSFTFDTASPTTTFSLLGNQILTDVYIRKLVITPLSTIAPAKFVQPYQSIAQAADSSYLEKRDYHDRVYFSLMSHNNSDMRTALQLLNSSSCDRLTDPFEKRANRGLNAGEQAGSIAFASSFVTGEYE